MNITRRSLLLSTGVLASLPVTSRSGSSRSRFKAIAFDGFPIFDPRPIAAHAESLYPGRGETLMNVWRTRQFEYQWLRTLGGRYADFVQVTRESLRFALGQLKIGIDSANVERLVDGFLHMPVWPDVPESIATLRGSGTRLVFLSNVTESILDDGLRRAGLREDFEHILSTDSLKTYKPDPRAYAMATTTLKLDRNDILFVAFAGWDAAGAKWFGYPTFWMNRAQAAVEELGVAADGVGPGMRSLLEFAGVEVR